MEKTEGSAQAKKQSQTEEIKTCVFTLQKLKSSKQEIEHRIKEHQTTISRWPSLSIL